MARKKVEDYLNEELQVINGRLSEFVRYGYSGELSPLVQAMIDYKNKLIDLIDAERINDLKRRGKI